MFFIVLGCKISIDINAELSHDTAKEFNQGNNNFKKYLPQFLHKHLHKQIGISITFRYTQRKLEFLQRINNQRYSSVTKCNKM